MNGKKYLALTSVFILLLATAGTVLAEQSLTLNSVYNRPNPLMDYVPQEYGIYDTHYEYLGEYDCRFCHGSSTADRHHYSDTVLIFGQCTPCHNVGTNGVVILPARRDCTGYDDCHTWDNIKTITDTHGWHHQTNSSGSWDCVSCHDRNLVADVQDRFVGEYPPSFITPTPYSCENCHWEQLLKTSQVGFDGTTGTEQLAGHPSTFHHYDQWGNPFPGTQYFEYAFGTRCSVSPPECYLHGSPGARVSRT